MSTYLGGTGGATDTICGDTGPAADGGFGGGGGAGTPQCSGGGGGGGGAAHIPQYECTHSCIHEVLKLSLKIFLRLSRSTTDGPFCVFEIHLR